MCPGAYKTQALPRAPPRALTNQTWTATSRPTSDCRSLSSFFHSASSFLVCCHLVFCLSCWQALFSLRLTLLHFASISPSGTFFFPFHPEVFHTHNTYCSISSPLAILGSSPVFCCDTILQRTRKGALPPLAAVYFPSTALFVMFKAGAATS